MPFKSKVQQGWMFANEPEMAKRWAAETPKGKVLPHRVGENPAMRRQVKKAHMMREKK